MLDNIKAGLMFLAIIVPYIFGVSDIFGFIFRTVSNISCTLN